MFAFPTAEKLLCSCYDAECQVRLPCLVQQVQSNPDITDTAEAATNYTNDLLAITEVFLLTTQSPSYLHRVFQKRGDKFFPGRFYIFACRSVCSGSNESWIWDKLFLTRRYQDHFVPTLTIPSWRKSKHHCIISRVAKVIKSAPSATPAKWSQRDSWSPSGCSLQLEEEIIHSLL